jgi:flagellin-like hook-associated protein FlgL
MVRETVEPARHQVLTQAGTAMLGHANQSARSVLSLLS